MKTASIRAEWEGQLVDGRFPLLEWLGGSDERGVFLTVLQGIQKAAIKLIPAEGAEADSYLAQWEAARKLTHPHLMAVLETGRFTFAGTDLVYVVTEFAEKSLSQTIAARALGAREVRGFLDPVLEALAYLHGKGFVHGHVKPSNLLMVAEQWKLSGDDLLVAGEFPELAWIPGGYDAPEAMNGSITAAMDTWSLGMALAETLTQHPVAWDWAAKVVPAVPQGLPRPFDEIVQECLRTDPAQRCSLEGIKALLKDTGSVAEVARPVGTTNGLTRMKAEPMRAMAETSRSAGQPRWTENEPIPAEEPVRGVAQPRWQEPEPVRPIKAEGRREPAVSQDEREPVDFDRGPTLFADIEEANLTGFSLMPWVIGGLVVLALAGVFLVRTGKIPWPLWPPNAPASSQSQPPSQPPSTQPGEGQGGSAAGETPPQQAEGAAPGGSEGTPQAGQAVPQSPLGAAPEPQTQEPESGQYKSAPDKGSAPLTGQSRPKQPLQEPSSKAKSAPATGKAAPEPKVPETRAATRANAEGAVADRVVPDLPEAARESMHGPQTAVIQVFVNPDGRVSNAAYVSSGPGNYFARTAMRAAKEWKFNPPVRSGHPQPSVWTLRFFFTRSNAEVNAVEDGR